MVRQFDYCRSVKTSKRYSKIFKALSNPNRLELFLKILDGHGIDVEGKAKTCFLAGLCENLNIGAPTVSHHIKELVNAGLIETEKQGKFTTCTLNDNVLAELRGVFAEKNGEGND